MKRNQKCVVKYYNDKFVFEQDFWSREIDAHKKANQLASVWNKTQFCNKPITVLVPEQQLLSKTNNQFS